MTRVRGTPLYGNCIIQAPDGQSLCRASMDKIQWYLDRNLGTLVSDNPTTLRLAFEPKARNGADHPYNTAFKQNICVVCGKENEITRHHVVPRCFRKHFPSPLKEHAVHDVLILCVNCHNEYEDQAFELKKQISQEMDVPIVKAEVNKDVLNVRTAAHALVNYYDKIPNPRREELLDRLRKFYGRHEVTWDDILEAHDLHSPVESPDRKSFGQIVVEKLEDIDEFIFRWRQHFISAMKPKYLPNYWDVYNKLT